MKGRQLGQSFLFVCFWGHASQHVDLSFSTRDQSFTPCRGSTALNHQGSPLLQNFERLESLSFTTMILGRSQLLRRRFLESESHLVVSNSLRPHRLYSPWNSPGQNTGVDSLSLPQGIFPTQDSNPGLPHCRWILYQLSHKGSSRILEWVAYTFSSGSS